MNVHGKCQITRNARKTLKNSVHWKKTLPAHLNPSQHHYKVLEFMAGNGVRQLGEPWIGEFAKHQRPEPVHNGINAWQHILVVISNTPLEYVLGECVRVMGTPAATAQPSGWPLQGDVLCTRYAGGRTCFLRVRIVSNFTHAQYRI